MPVFVQKFNFMFFTVGQDYEQASLYRPHPGRQKMKRFFSFLISIVLSLIPFFSHASDPSAKPSSTTQTISPLSSEESSKRIVNLLKRFHDVPLGQLDSKSIQFRIQPDRGLIVAKNLQTNTIWQSTPDATALGVLSATNGSDYVNIPLNKLKIVSQNQRQCVLEKEYNGNKILTLEITLDRNDPIVKFSWEISRGWLIEEIEWNSFLWTTETLGGGVVIPRMMGEYFKADSGIEFTKTFNTYKNCDGLHIPMAGIIRRDDGALLSWDDVHTSAIAQSSITSESAFPGSQVISLGLKSNTSISSFRLHLIRGNTYIDLACAYRDHAKEKGTLITLEQKAKRSRELERLYGAPEFKPVVCSLQNPESENGNIENALITHYTEYDCHALANHLHNDLKIKKALFVLAGWNHTPYENQPPDTVSAAPEIGGNEGIRRLSNRIRSYGWLFGLHDDCQYIDEDVLPSNSRMITMNPNGEGTESGSIPEEQAWLIASQNGLELAKINLPQVRNLFNPNAYFIDMAFASPLFRSFNSGSSLPDEDDLRFKKELSRYAAKLFGVHGSEYAFEFGVPDSHYFEGIMSGKELAGNFPDSGAIRIPFFPLVFGDCVVMYNHQEDRAGIGDARMILKHLVTGTMPLYEIGPHRYWQNVIPEVDYTNPKYCFAKGEGGWGEKKHPVDCFIKNTYTFLSPFAEGVAELPMTQHRYLKEDGSVEYAEFGDLWMAVVNYGPDDYSFGRTILPPMGFIATGPDYLAQHYYPTVDNDTTALIVKQDGKTYHGFR